MRETTMGEKELIKKLENVKLPDIEIQSHRRRLRMALLESRYFEGHPRVAVSSLAKSKMKGGIEMLRRLISWRPAWKPALVGTLAIALIVGSALFVPLLVGPSPEVLAAEIAQNSPEVQKLLGDDLIVIKKVQLVDGVGHVVCEASIGTFALAEVDLEKKELVKVESIKMPELTEEEKDKAIEIAKADPKVQELLDKGARIDRLFPMFSIFSLAEEDGEVTVETSVNVSVALVLDNEKWMVHVNLEKGKVERILEPRERPYDVEEVEYKRIKKLEVTGPINIPPMTEEERAEIVDIAKADPEVQELLKQGAEINESFIFFTYEGPIASQGEDKITLREMSKDKAQLILELKENGEVVKSWIVTIDPAVKKVVSIEPVLMAERAYSITIES